MIYITGDTHRKFDYRFRNLSLGSNDMIIILGDAGINYYLNHSDRLLKDKLSNLDIRCELDNRDEKLGYKMRESQTRKIPYTLILGDKEKETKTISYRLHGEKETKTMEISEFITMLNNQIKEHK